ncbi:hypothetical protein PAPHI01_1596 [Pancytospora philotis]|nr:hypothetical protein PAPHI01_1596 [Pancytospora philotis]
MEQTQPFTHPVIGSRVRCRVDSASFAAANVSVIEVDGRPSSIAYRGVLKGGMVAEGTYVNEKLRPGDCINCLVVAYSDAGVVVSEE